MADNDNNGLKGKSSLKKAASTDDVNTTHRKDEDIKRDKRNVKGNPDSAKGSSDNVGKKRIRYAVVGLGHIAQVAVLPAFEHAKENSELVALVSSDDDKLEELSKRYGVKHTYTYDQYDECLKSGQIDAVYIALPNNMHLEYTVKAAEAGVHVLCEKPMATSIEDAKKMIHAAQKNRVKLMIAYRLHFEKANMSVVDLIHKGKIGQPRLFSSTFTMQVREGNIRTRKELGGGPLFDIGIYCINAARYIFKAQPIEVQAIMVQGTDPRFEEIEEAVGAILRFPNQCIATFICSFGSHDVSEYRVVGTEGEITVEPAYDYVEELKYRVRVGQSVEEHTVAKSDQFAPELKHFSECILNDEEPRPSGYEGLADLQVIESLTLSADGGRAIPVEQTEKRTSMPDATLIEQEPPVEKPKLIKVKSGSK